MQSNCRVGLIAPFKTIYMNAGENRAWSGGGEITTFLANYITISHIPFIVGGNVALEDPQYTDVLFVIACPWSNQFDRTTLAAERFLNIIRWMSKSRKIIYLIPDPSPAFRYPDARTLENTYSRFVKPVTPVSYIRNIREKPVFANVETLLIIPDVYSDNEKISLTTALKIPHVDKCHFINLTSVSWINWNRKRLIFGSPKSSLNHDLVYVGNNRAARLKALKKYHYGLKVNVYGNWKPNTAIEIFGIRAHNKGRLKHTELRTVYNHKTTSVITVDSHVNGLSYYPTRMWEILRYGGSLLISEEAKFNPTIWDEWIVKSADNVSYLAEADYWKKQVEALSTITPTKVGLYKQLNRLIKDII